MKTISDNYKGLLEHHHYHAQRPFGVAGGKWFVLITNLLKSFDCKTVLDYGAGKGVLSAKLRQTNFDVTEYDPAVKGKEQKPEEGKIFDFVTSTDVLEHIEPDYIDAVLDEMERYTGKAGFFVICLGPARKHWLKDGRNAHLIVKPRKWWFEKLQARWNVRELYGRGWKDREMCVLVTKKQ